VSRNGLRIPEEGQVKVCRFGVTALLPLPILLFGLAIMLMSGTVAVTFAVLCVMLVVNGMG
jgi:hypothetical protein